MDPSARQQLMTEIKNQKERGGEIVVPLDLFFVGNDDRGSIGCNLGGKQPAIHEFYEAFLSLREWPQVQDVLVRICDADDEEAWPFTDTVYVISSLSQTDLENELRKLAFDEISEGWIYGKPVAAPDPKPGFSPNSIWWD